MFGTKMMMGACASAPSAPSAPDTILFMNDLVLATNEWRLDGTLSNRLLTGREVLDNARVIDGSNLASLSSTYSLNVGYTTVRDVAALGDYGAVACSPGGALCAVDLTTGSVIDVLSIGTCYCVTAFDNSYLAAGSFSSNLLYIVDWSDKENLSTVASIATTSPQDIWTTPDAAWVSDSGTGVVNAFDCDVKNSPSSVGTYTFPFQIYRGDVNANRLFAGQSIDNVVHLVDWSDLSTPVLRSSTIGAGAEGVARSLAFYDDDILVVRHGDLKARIWDVSDPTTPTIVGESTDANVTGTNGEAVVIDNVFYHAQSEKFEAFELV